MFVVKRTDFTLIQIVNREMGQKKNNMNFWVPVKKNKVHVTELKSSRKPATFQASLRTTLIIGQAFSLIPVNGVFSNNASDVRFVWSSWKCLYLLLSLMGQIFIVIMCVNKVVHSVTSLNATTPIIFYGTTCITMVMFFRVARSWPNLVHHVTKTEELDPNFDQTLAKRCNVTCAVVLTLALSEHILSLLSAFAGASVCFPNANLYEGFVRHFYPWVFDFLPYSPLLGILTQVSRGLLQESICCLLWTFFPQNLSVLQMSALPHKIVNFERSFLHFQSTFIWNFSDLFVICMSYYLTSRLNHINKKLLAAQGKYLPEIFWRTTREDYGRAAQLVRRVDDVISGVVFISFANNLFFICLQLFNTLEDGIKGTGDCSSRSKSTSANILGGYEAATYFFFSLVYLITRSVAVSLIASQVNSASTVPAPVLYDVPSPVYCVEVQRFLDQVNGDKLALSGLQFFSVTRSLLLTVAGTIVTYELVMFQFTTPSSTSSTTDVSNITTIMPMPSQ